MYPLTVDATPSNYNSFLPDRAGNNNLNSTFIQKENLNFTRNLTPQDIQTPSHFVTEEVVETITTTVQQISHLFILILQTQDQKNPKLPQVTLQSTLKPSVAPKSHKRIIKHLDQ